MTIDRKQLIEEMKLREQIRKAIKIVKERKKKSQQGALDEEQKLRKFIRKMILSEKASVTPEKTTAVTFMASGIAYLLDLQQNRVVIAIDKHFLDDLHIAAFFAFHPLLVARPAVEPGFPSFQGFFPGN